VIATDVGSVRDLVVDGSTGIVVPRRDPAALGAAMKALLADDGRRKAMGEAGRARVREKYPLDRCVAETGTYLRKVAGRA
jgi:glycosyltransferase involved in cell wall biosynthesis